MTVETDKPGEVKWCQHCGCHDIANHRCGPFVVRETYGCDSDGKTYYVAVHEPTGFCFTGRASRGEASADARIGNAVLRTVVDDDTDRGRAMAWGSVANTLSRVVPNWYKVASTGERSAVATIERLASEARQVQPLRDALAMCIRPMERAGLVACADQCRRVLFGSMPDAAKMEDSSKVVVNE